MELDKIAEEVLDNIDDMQFGMSAEKDTGGNTSDGGWIKYIKEDGETTLRFIDEWPEWISYYEHYDPDMRVSYPCTGNKSTCVGCRKREGQPKDSRDGVGNAHRLLVNALDKEGYVHLWKLPFSLRENLVKVYEKYGTITNRDFTINRYKTGGNTKYSIMNEDKEPYGAEKMSELRGRRQDMNDALKEMYRDAFDEQRVAERNERKAKREVEEPKKADAVKTELKEATTKSMEEDTPPFEQEEREYTVQEIHSMPVKRLRALLLDNDIDFTLEMDQRTLANTLIENLS